MSNDLDLDLGAWRLNIRCGAVMCAGDRVVLEISRVGQNATIPGGRLRTGEDSRSALLREMTEEMGLSLDPARLTPITVLENFFHDGAHRVQEIYFVYRYALNVGEIAHISRLQGNMDNAETYFAFVPKCELPRHNLLPTTLLDLIRV